MSAEQVTDEELVRLYVDQERGLDEVAMRAGVSRTTVRKRLVALGVEIRPRGGLRTTPWRTTGGALGPPRQWFVE